MGGEAPGSGPGAAVGVVYALVAALVAERVGEVEALTDPGVVWVPASRPALSVYRGHSGMALLVADLRARLGRFRLVLEDAGAVGAGAGAGVVVRARVTVVRQQPGGGEVAERPVLAEFTVRGGVVTWMEGHYEE